jgi:hypothetical protein
MRLADKPPQRILREAGAPLRRGWRPYGRSRQAGGQLLLPSRVRRREHETPAPDPLETGEVHIVHDDHPRCKADFRADRVSQRSCRADRCPMVRESLDEFPIPVRKEAIDREFTSHRIGSAPDCHCARGVAASPDAVTGEHPRRFAVVTGRQSPPYPGYTGIFYRASRVACMAHGRRNPVNPRLASPCCGKRPAPSGGQPARRERRCHCPSAVGLHVPSTSSGRSDS